MDPDTLINDLIELNLPKNLILFIYNLISVIHTQFINYPGNIIRSTFKGLPQGSILSPILFSIYINKMNDLIMPEIKILKFANDIALFTTNSQLEVNLKSLEQQIKVLSVTLANRNLQLAPEKCKLVIFNRTNIAINNSHIKIENTNIQPTSHVKFLGIILDKRLNWNFHIQGLDKII